MSTRCQYTAAISIRCGASARIFPRRMPKIVEPKAAEQAYSVKAGDTLSKIAAKFGVAVAALRTRNGLTSDLILVGQALVIPA